MFERLKAAMWRALGHMPSPLDAGKVLGLLAGLLVLALAFSWAGNALGLWKDHIGDFWFDRKDQQRVEEIMRHRAAAAGWQRKALEADAERVEANTKFRLAMKVMESEGKSGGEIENVINEQIERGRNLPDANSGEPVLDADLLERLRQREAAKRSRSR